MKKEDLSKEYIDDILNKLTEIGIKYDTQFCDRPHAYVLHCWIDENYKCNMFLRTQRWTPFGYHKGISGQGIEELKMFLQNAEKNFNRKKEYSYKEKFEALRDILLQVRNEQNFDIIDEALAEYF